jgi:hypothetical protein
MKPLTLDKALQLYDIIGKHLPQIEEDMDAMEFIGTIVKSIKESGQHKDYTDAIMLMSGKTWEELRDMKFDEVLELFISGLSENKIIELESFCNKMGYIYA